MVLLLWIFVIDEFLLYGVQFSNSYAETLGSHAVMKRMNKAQLKRQTSEKSLINKLKRK